MSSNDNEQLAVLRRMDAERAVRVLCNEYPERKFYLIINSARDTDYSYAVYHEGRANKDIRTFAAGVCAALRSL